MMKRLGYSFISLLINGTLLRKDKSLFYPEHGPILREFRIYCTRCGLQVISTRCAGCLLMSCKSLFFIYSDDGHTRGHIEVRENQCDNALEDNIFCEKNKAKGTRKHWLAPTNTTSTQFVRKEHPLYLLSLPRCRGRERTRGATREWAAPTPRQYHLHHLELLELQ